MSEPNYSISFTASMSASDACNVGDVLLYDSTLLAWRVATAANRASLGVRASAIAITPYGQSPNAKVGYKDTGILSASTSGLGVGTASWVRASAAGRCERFTPTNGGTSDIIGYCETDGRLHLLLGIFTETMAVGGGGSGGASPAGNAGNIQTNAGGGLLGALAGGAAGRILISTGVDTWAPLAAGTAGQLLTMVSGVPTWADPALDPTTLAWSAYYRASYPGTSPWSGVTTAGTSGAGSLAQATGTQVPAQGAAVDGFFPCAPDGVDDILQEARAASNVVATTGYTLSVMFKAPTGATADPNAYVDQQLACISGDIVGIGWTSSGIRAWHYDGTNWAATAFIACSANAWHLAIATFSGGVLSLSLDGGTAVTVSKGNVSGAGGSFFQIGRTRNAGDYDAIQRLEVGGMLSAMSTSNQAKYRTYLKARYPSAGLP